MLPKHKYLLTYRYAEVIHDLTVIFVKKYIDYKSRTRDQMEQAARSAKQNIVEGVSQQASLKGQIKLLGVAQASTEELLTDYEDFLRQRNLTIWPKTDKRVSQYRQWGIQATKSYPPEMDRLLKLLRKLKEEEIGNLMVTLCHQLSYLLTKQIRATEKRFVEKGGYSENLFLKRLKSLKLPKSPKTAFTLLELLIVISLIVLIGLAVLALFNPKTQIEKAWDGKRKKELNTLQKVFEDFYNDKNCYPKPEEVCYDPKSSLADGTYTCHICGNEASSPSFSPYLERLPCDPQSQAKEYLYQVDDQNCPTWYRIYTKLSDENDPQIAQAGCTYGCGPGSYIYSYGVSSPNIGLETGPGDYYCSDAQGNCTQVSDTEICTPSFAGESCDGGSDPTSPHCQSAELIGHCE